MRNLLKQIITVYVDYVAFLRSYSFPPKYGLRWKLRVLFKRYEPETTRLIKDILKPGMTFVDIGAHIGYFTRLAAQRVGVSGRVVAFEADRENLVLLKKNSAPFSNITIVPEAISDTKGNITFYHVRGSTGCHSVVPHDDSRAEIVSATTLDDFLERRNMPRVDVIKMDIEGGEWKALLGMEKTIAASRVQLILEYNPDSLRRAGIDPHDLLRWLYAHDFLIHVLTSGQMTELLPHDIGNIDHLLSAEGSVNIYCAKQ